MSSAVMVELTVRDLPGVVPFVCGQVAAYRGEAVDAAAAMSRYRWLFDENPRRQGEFIGWGLRGPGGELAGTNLCCWQHYQRDGEIRRALHSGDYYVTESARGPSSLGLLLSMQRHPAADLIMCATANVNGAAVWNAMRAQPAEGAGWELLVPVNLTALAMGALARRLPDGILRRAAAALGAGFPRTGRRFRCPPGVTVEQVADGDIARVQAPPATGLWEPARDAAWLEWRYVSEHARRRCRLLRLSRSIGGDLFVGIHLGSRGVGARVRSLTVMDVWGASADFPAGDVIASLAVFFRSRIDVMSLRLLAARLWRDQLGDRARFRELGSKTHWLMSRKFKPDPAEWAFSMGDGDGCA